MISSSVGCRIVFPPPWQAIARHARPCHTLPALPPPSLGPARRSAPDCSRRLRTFSIIGEECRRALDQPRTTADREKWHLDQVEQPAAQRRVEVRQIAEIT